MEKKIKFREIRINDYYESRIYNKKGKLICILNISAIHKDGDPKPNWTCSFKYLGEFLYCQNGLNSFCEAKEDIEYWTKRILDFAKSSRDLLIEYE